MRSGAEHLRVSYDALPHDSHRRRLVAAAAVLAFLAVVGVAAVALVGIG